MRMVALPFAVWCVGGELRGVLSASYLAEACSLFRGSWGREEADKGRINDKKREGLALGLCLSLLLSGKGRKRLQRSKKDVDRLVCRLSSVFLSTRKSPAPLCLFVLRPTRTCGGVVCRGGRTRVGSRSSFVAS